MEWLSVKMRNMGLRRFYILVSALSLLTALLCTAVTFWVCIRLREQVAPAGLEIEYDLYGNPVSSEFASPPSAEQWRMANLIQSLQYVLPVIYFTAAVIVSGAVIYRCKLREPIRMLQSGAQRIMEQDLDFTISSDSGDELGQLCAAFEKMRGQLQKNNRELWRQAEERRRLNAAFSHDLRNPVTVLKGSVRLMEKSLVQDNLLPENIRKNLAQMSRYTERIADYIEVMSSAQRLEDTPCIPKAISFGKIRAGFQEGAGLLLQDCRVRLVFAFHGSDSAPLWLDEAIFSAVSENLLTNAGRYAEKEICTALSLRRDRLILKVEDDGEGFSEELLRKGMQPFVRGDKSDPGHFGMGLYICRLLCEKHGGSLHLTNGASGAVVTAELKISKS
ncbi:MAG: HAMP domain-containing sensor histidine kinase [Anaerovoracaceae bacterium]